MEFFAILSRNVRAFRDGMMRRATCTDGSEGSLKQAEGPFPCARRGFGNFGRFSAPRPWNLILPQIVPQHIKMDLEDTKRYSEGEEPIQELTHWWRS